MSTAPIKPESKTVKIGKKVKDRLGNLFLVKDTEQKADNFYVILEYLGQSGMVTERLYRVFSEQFKYVD